VLKGIDISVHEHEAVALIGASGSGKSTILRCIDLLAEIDDGDIFLDGDVITDPSVDEVRVRRKLGFVFQAYNLVPVLTAEENILLPLTLAGRKPDSEWHDTLIEAIGLGDRLTHRPSELSGGQQQRVAVARALIHRPAVVFADEPTGNLDSKSSDEVLGLLRQAVDEFGQTVVMVTHDPHAASVADRIVVLRDGEVVHDAEETSTDTVVELLRAAH
jgi:putative ABC transport system ATP-binding protein